MSQRQRLMKQKDLPETEEETEEEAEQFLDDWELQALLINDKKLMESKKDETGSDKTG